MTCISLHGIDLVECPPRALSLTAVACVADFMRARDKKPEAWESRWHCHGCTLGAGRAGLSSRAAWPDGMCVRCHRAGLRIVTRAGHCVSCYNRQHEVEAGVNGRGGFPTLTAQRYTFQARILSVGEDAGVMVRHTVTQTTSVLEGIFTTLRGSHSTQVFGRSPPEVGCQGSFWGGG